MFCLPKYLVDKFLGKLKSGEIDPEKLSAMTSAERNAFFSSFLGEINAAKVNALFESKLLLKNQQQGIINWAKQVSGMKPEVKRDMLSRVEKMTKILEPKDAESFLADLAKQKLGVDVTMDEASNISELAKNVAQKKELIPEASPIRGKERLDYGLALMEFRDYVGNLKMEAEKLTPKEFLVSPKNWIESIGGLTKSILASMDNSFFGRQGLVSLVNHPVKWADAFLKSFGDIKKELKGIDAITPIKADIYSRPNALNGKYKAMGLDIGIESEEAFPSPLPEKIPVLGRLYKASESAYNGAALRLRADIADALIKEAEAMGVDVKDRKAGIGKLVNSMTGRGKIEMLAPTGQKLANVALFSIKFLKGNIDVLTAHILDPNMGRFAKKKAAHNLLRLIGVLGAVLTTAKILDPESVEPDPRSSNFGNIMVGKNHEIKINISGGFNSLATLASRIVPTIHDGKWGFWTKTAKGEYKRLGGGKFGDRDPSEVVFDFMKGKAAPIARALLDVWEGQTFEREPVTIKGELLQLFTPLPVTNLMQLAKTSAGEQPLMMAILSALELGGVNVNPRFFNIPQEEIKDYMEITKQLKESNAKKEKQNEYAEITWNKMKGMPAANKREMYIDIKKRSPQIAARIKEIALEERQNLSYTERMIKSLGVENGQRSKFLWNKIKSMPSARDRQEYYDKMLNKGIITEKVANQIKIRARLKK